MKSSPYLFPKLSLSQKLVATISITSIVGILFSAVLFSIENHEEIESGQSFTNVADHSIGHAGSDLAISTSSDGGFAWGDINGDGCLDLAVNTNSKSPGTRILISDCDPENPTFSDQTSTLCPGCESSTKSDRIERSANLADLNHDGYPDLVINGNALLEIYKNAGPPSHSFGTPVLSITGISGGMNAEGVFLVDYDNNGWLDIILENHNFGIDLYENPGDGSFNFSYVNPSGIGLPLSADDGDYGTALDFDDDGDVDIVARKNNQADFYINQGNGTFSSGVDIEDAQNSNKGGVSLADFDNDGDYDMYWTDNGTNQIWLNHEGTLQATATSGDGEPWASAGVTAPATGIDGCAVGDVNNDGKVDLFLTNDSGSGYLFLNETENGGTLSFSQNNLDINLAGNGEGAAFADYDNDGDLDLYVVMASAANQLWRNSLNDDNYLFVEPRIDLGSDTWRSAVGANVILKDCEGNVISGIREVSTVSGHGTDSPDRVHFGLPNGPESLYNVVVKFVTVDGTRVEVEKQISPSLISNRVLIVYDTDENAIGRCQDFDQDDQFDRYDLDDDNDGIPDIAEIYRGDHDGDGVLDYEDPDFCTATFSSAGWICANGLPDPSEDLDADGILNYADADFYGCGGLVNGVCVAFDQDRDGIPNHKDLDSDNDGIPDLIENKGTDIEGNGLVDGFAGDTLLDTDSDGWYDLYDSYQSAHTSGTSLVIVDTDRDGVPDMFDLDSDNDGLTDAIEAGATDADGDGRADDFVDADDDGFSDHFDPFDSDLLTDNDASFSSSENLPLIVTGVDTDLDGVVDDSEGYEGGDTDGDGVLNHRDLDSDNDGIPDLIESGGIDSDGDGVTDQSDPDGNLRVDSDSDGYEDNLDPDLNNDGDTSDAGDTGLPLVISSQDSDGDGRPESFPAFDNDQNGSTATFSPDTDQDQVLNAFDLDSDNDGIADLVECGGIDQNGDGMVEGIGGNMLYSGSNDADGDGFYDDYDPDNNQTDADEDENNDPLITSVANGTGTTTGHPAVADLEGNSGLLAGRNIDFDGDGIPNFVDLDSDADGISDIIESFGNSSDTDENSRADNFPSNDTNDDGWHDDYANVVITSTDAESEIYPNTLPDYEAGSGEMDADADGLPNYLDIDSDNDGILDLIESQPSSLNVDDIFDGLIVGGASDLDYDGLADEYDADQVGTFIAPQNTDGADEPDYLDLDSDNDSYLDEMEGHDADFDGDADRSAVLIDTDQDGLDDSYDTNESSFDHAGSNQSIQDSNGDLDSGGDRDWRDVYSTLLPVEWSSFEGVWNGSMVDLTWSTVTEHNSDYFDILRSYDSQEYQSIGQVSAAGNSAQPINYGFTDRTPGMIAGSEVFYQIRQVDLDGNSHLSPVVNLTSASSTTEYLRAFPNPVDRVLNLEFGWEVEKQASLSVISITGQEITRKTLPFRSHETTVDMGAYPSGSYFVVIRAGNTVLRKRVEKR